jgi:hypothetical protein
VEKKFYVIPYKEGWLVKAEGKQGPIASYPRKEEAVKRGIAEARMQEAVLVIEHEDGRTETQSFYNQPAV